MPSRTSYLRTLPGLVPHRTRLKGAKTSTCLPATKSSGGRSLENSSNPGFGALISASTVDGVRARCTSAPPKPKASTIQIPMGQSDLKEQNSVPAFGRDCGRSQDEAFPGPNPVQSSNVIKLGVLPDLLIRITIMTTTEHEPLALCGMSSNEVWLKGC